MLKSLKTLFRIIGFAGRFKFMLIIGMLLLLVDVVFSIGIVICLQNMVNAMADNDINKLFTLLIFTVLGSITCIMLKMLGSALRKYASVQANKNMAIITLDHVNKLKYCYLQQNHSGDLIERINTDTSKAIDVINSGIVPLVTNILTSIAAFIYLSDINLELALLAAATGPITFGAGRFFDSKIRIAAEELNNREGTLRGILQEFLQSMAIVRILGIKNVFLNKFNAIKDEQLKIVKNKALLNTIMWRCVVLVNMSVTILLAYSIGKAAINSIISIGAVLSFLFLLGRLQWPFVEISSTWGTINNAFGNADRVFKILDTETEDYGCFHESCAKTYADYDMAVEIADMGFSYEDNQVFDNFNLKIKKGETVGIVGYSGCGKTTLAKLCCGLFIPEKGDIKILGNSIRNNLADARNQLAYVSQTPYVFSGTVGENILMGCANRAAGSPENADSSKERAEAAAYMANAHSFISKLDNGYNSVLKENGSNLSGGQKQRLNIARALAKDSPIIIFDEATSSLDNESEMLVQDTVNNLMGHKTLIVIAHRLTTIQNLSRIIVLNNGKIAEEGTHNELIALKGIYNTLWQQSVVQS